MSSITDTSSRVVRHIPLSLLKRLGTHDLSFGQLQGIYRDGMDRCQYDEVIPTAQDKASYEEMLLEEAIPLDQLKIQLGTTK